MIFQDKIGIPLSDQEFAFLALGAFRYQYQHNHVYRAFSDALRRDPSNVLRLDDIPFLPISFFKTHRIYAPDHEPRKVFLSSGTSGMERSRHYIADLSLYRKSLTVGFRLFYGEPDDYRIFALTPTPTEAPDSSLVYMVQTLMGDHDGFLSPGNLRQWFHSDETRNKKTMLVGTTFALLDFIEQGDLVCPELVVVETGGMKGRRKELVREEVHKRLAAGFGVPVIHSEYGMAELLSQAWSQGNGLYRCPPWMRISLRDITDPLSPVIYGDTGGINIIDLANIYSCPFIATQDLGRMHEDKSFEVLGRYDDAEIRGCSLMSNEQ